MKLIKQLFIVLCLFSTSLAYANEPVLGKDYTVLNPTLPTNSGNKIEVLEFFSYGCIHCYNLNSMMGKWEKKMPKDVSFKYVPIVFAPSMEIPARAFYAAEFLGMHAKLHNVLFDIWHADHPPYDEASATNAVVKKGVDRTKFHDAYNSFSMKPSLARAMAMQKTYNIRGTPTLVVAGKYVIPGESAHAVQILNALINKARKDRKH
ncbi:MAG: thiol:disulfide interchange protein DsbA/DsbL [Gallionellaceae bacterium]